MSFTAASKVGEIAAANPRAKKVLEDAGLDYCCGGEKSLHDACLRGEVSPQEILKRLQENSELAGPDEANWVSASLSELTQHIREKHHRYVREFVPRVIALLAKVKAKHGQNHLELAGIEELFTNLGREMYSHMQKEEQILFP